MQMSVERQLLKAAYYAGFGNNLDTQIAGAVIRGEIRARLHYDFENTDGKGQMIYTPEFYIRDNVGKLNGFHATAIRGFKLNTEIAGVHLRELMIDIQMLPGAPITSWSKEDKDRLLNIEERLSAVRKEHYPSFAAIAGEHRHPDLLLTDEDKAAISEFRIKNVRSKWIPNSDQLTIQEAELIMLDMHCPRAFVKRLFEIPEQEGQTEAQRAHKGFYAEHWRYINFLKPNEITIKKDEGEIASKAKKAALEKDIPDGMVYLVKRPEAEIPMESIHSFNFIGLDNAAKFAEFSKAMRKGETMELDSRSQQHPKVTVAVNGVHATWRFIDPFGRFIRHNELYLQNERITVPDRSEEKRTGAENMQHRRTSDTDKKKEKMKPPQNQKAEKKTRKLK
jgi:hypothetical protein